MIYYPYGNKFQPLRAKEHQEAIWQGIKDGTLQVIATDHCSFDFHGDKQNGKDDFTKCPNGAPEDQENQENLAACKAQAEALIAKFPLYPAGAFED